VVNQLHGWTCPTCGTERSECDSGAGTVVLEEAGPLPEGPSLPGARLTDAELRVRNASMVASTRKVADEIRCVRAAGHRFARVAGTFNVEKARGMNATCLDCGLVLLPEPKEPPRPADLTPTLQDARAIPCEETQPRHSWIHRLGVSYSCFHCGLVVRDS